MRIRESGGQLHLYRYGGAVDGKQLEVKIGTVPVTAQPRPAVAGKADGGGGVDPDLWLDLTGREQQQLVEHLKARHAEAHRNEVAETTKRMQAVAGLLNAEVLAEEAARDLWTAIAQVEAALKSSGFARPAKSAKLKPVDLAAAAPSPALSDASEGVTAH